MQVAALAAALAAAPATPLGAQDRAESAAFVVRLGTDTLSVERFRRSASRLEGELVTRSPRTSVRRYVADLGRDGAVMRLEVAILPPGAPAGAPPLQRTVASFAGESIRVEVVGVSEQASAVAAPAGAALLLGGAFAPYELVTMRWRRLRLDSAVVPAYVVGARAAQSVALTRLGRDSALLATQLVTFRVRLGRGGRIVGLHAPGSTQQIRLDRVRDLDAGALAAAWGANDDRGLAMGMLSPRDTARAVIAGASLLVDYGRPRKRGRAIFGDVVPWHVVWRTGANAATQLRTDRDLAFGAVTVPAGTYSLWTLPAPSGWQLVINRQTGQWGTQYDAGRDLARLPLSVDTLAAPVEVFTIAIGPLGQGGVLSLAWDRTRTTIPFTVR